MALIPLLQTGVIVAVMTIVSPAADAASRQVLLDAARTSVESDLGKPVKFRIDRLKLNGPHAFLLARLEDGHGHPLDFAGTRLAGAAAEGLVSHRYAALLHRDANRWSVVTAVVGPGDVAWRDWATSYKVPPGLFDQ